MSDNQLKKVDNQAIVNLKQDIINNYQKELMNYFAKDEAKMLKFMSGVVYAIQKVPSLLTCSRDSLISATLELAQIGIAPSIRWQAYILPYKDKATAIIWYQWWVEILSEAGIQIISAEIVRENDVFENIIGSEPKIIHKVDPKLSKDKRGAEIWAYIVLKVSWETMYKYMHIDDILKFKEFSQSKTSEYSPWNEKNDPERWMYKKTVLKQFVKILPKNEKIDKAFEIDNSESPAHGTLPEITTWWADALKAAQEALAKINWKQVETPEVEGEIEIPDNQESWKQ